MADILHIIDEHTSDESLLVLSSLKGENEPILCLGQEPVGLGTLRIDRRIKPSVFFAGQGAGALAAAAQPGQRFCLWSMAHLNTVQAAADILGGKLIAYLPALPVGQELDELPWKMAEIGLNVILPTASEQQALLSQGAPAGAVHLLPTPCPPLGQPQDEPVGLRKKMGLKKNELLLVAPQEMQRNAGHKWVCWAHAILQHTGLEMSLLFPRLGPDEEHVRFFANTTGFIHKMQFLQGGCDDATVLAAADIVLFFGDHDFGQGRLLQAMAAGKCILASQTLQQSELLADGKNALMTRTSNPRGFSSILLKAGDDPKLRATLGRQAQSDVALRPEITLLRQELGNLLKNW